MANRVFISWSGTRSQGVALVWKSLIEELFDTLDAFISSQDIDAGSRGLSIVKQELDDSSVGISVITQENHKAEWINFEAGALSKQIADSLVRVIPCLVDYEDPAELTGPLSQFQARVLDKNGVADTLQVIANVNDIPWTRKQATFDARWDHFETEFNKAKASAKSSKEVRRNDRDMLIELVNTTREIHNNLAKATSRPVTGGSYSGDMARFQRVRKLLAEYAATFDSEPPLQVARNLGNVYLLVEGSPRKHADFIEMARTRFDVIVYVIKAVPLEL